MIPKFKTETRKGRIKSITYREDLEEFLKDPDRWEYITIPKSWSVGAKIYKAMNQSGEEIKICLKCRGNANFPEFINEGEECFNKLRRLVYEKNISYYEKPLGFYIEQNGISVLFTEALDGSSLEELEEKLLPKDERFGIIELVLENLKDLHSKKVAHGDAQCQNIMYVPNLENKIVFVDPKRAQFDEYKNKEREKILEGLGANIYMSDMSDYTLFISTAIKHKGLIRERKEAKEILEILKNYDQRVIPHLEKFFNRHRLPAEWEREENFRREIPKLKDDYFQLFEDPITVELYNQKSVQTQSQLDLAALKLGGLQVYGGGMAPTRKFLNKNKSYNEIIIPNRDGHIIIYYPFFRDALPIVYHTKNIRESDVRETVKSFLETL